MEEKLTIKSDLNSIRQVEKMIDDLSTKLGVEKNNYGKIMVAAMEAVNNAVIHGNKGNSEKKVFIDLKYENKQLIISVEDQGEGFSYNDIPDPTAPENIEKLTGRGVFLMRKLADEVKFNEKGNKVILIFNNVEN